jgi:phycocyanobilin lyase subunit beta
MGVASLQTLLADLDRADSAEKVRFAVEDLAAAALPESVPKLIQVLSYNNPGAAVAAVEGLIAIGEPAVMPLMELLDGYNYGARAWALRALAGIGDPRGADLLLRATLDDFALSVRRAAARGVGMLHWDDFAESEVLPAQTKALATLIKSATQDPEWVVRYAAVTGLEALALHRRSAIGDRRADIITTLTHLTHQDPEPAIQARSQWALQTLGEPS